MAARECPHGHGPAPFNRDCAAHVCETCGHHVGLERCWCGWSLTAPGRGREELEAMGETVEEAP